MTKHILRGLAIGLVAIMAAAFVASPVLAADLRGEETITVARGEVVDEDLYVAGSSIVIDGTVNGDLWAAGQEITINGTVNGSIVAAARTITISGEVDRAARLAGETLTINGNIKGDLFAFASKANISGSAVIDGDIIFGAGSSYIDGQVGGNIKGGGGEVRISNGVGGDITLNADALHIKDTANIQGNLTYTSESEADIEPDAKIGGTTTHNIPVVEEHGKKGFATGLTGKVLGFFMILVIGIIIVVIFPRKMTSLANSIQTKPWWSLLWGAVILIVTPIAAIIICITVIGIPVGLIALALYGIAIYLSSIVVALLIGRLILGRFSEVERKSMLIAALAIGLVILSILRLIPVAGFYIGLLIIIFGLGSLISSRVGLHTEA